MPVPLAIPVLSAVARLVLSHGGRQAAKKYGQAARKEGLRQGTRRGLETRLDRSRSGRDLPQIREEVPLKFAKGGSIDGKAIKGLTKGSRRI